MHPQQYLIAATVLAGAAACLFSPALAQSATGNSPFGRATPEQQRAAEQAQRITTIPRVLERIRSDPHVHSRLVARIQKVEAGGAVEGSPANVAAPPIPPTPMPVRRIDDRPGDKVGLRAGDVAVRRPGQLANQSQRIATLPKSLERIHADPHAHPRIVARIQKLEARRAMEGAQANLSATPSPPTAMGVNRENDRAGDKVGLRAGDMVTRTGK